MLTTETIIYIVLALLAALAAVAKKLTITGAVTGFLVAVFIFAGGGLTALIELAAFFVLGSWSTSVGLAKKKALGIAEENKGRRSMWQVLANGGVAALLGLLFAMRLFDFSVTLMIAGSLAAAIADTLSSELGNIYGSKYYNIITFKKDTRGLDGVISLEGTLAGVAGAGIIAIIYLLGSHDITGALVVVLAGTCGTIIDSVLGASLERRGRLNNNSVNFLNTLVGAASAGLLYIVLK